MKRYLIILLICLLSSNLLLATKLQATFNYCRFYSPSQGPYLETYLTFNGNSLNYVKLENGSFQAEVEVSFIFFKNFEVDKFKKYIVKSPIIADTSNPKPIFIDQQRIPLDNGPYNFEIQLNDLNADQEKFKANQGIVINFEADSLQISDIQLFDSIYKGDESSRISKSGFDIIPYQSTFFPVEVNKLGFYVEIYNSDKIIGKDEKYLITYFIENSETGNIINNYKGFKKKGSKSVSVLANTFYIKELPSGNYNLVIEVRNKTNELLLNKKLFFQRSNPLIANFAPELKEGTFVEKITNSDTLSEYIRSLEPISERLEVEFAENQLNGSELDLMQQYFLNFWVKRDPENPKRAWELYKLEVEKVNRNYNTNIQKGYLTPRGYRYLKYGPPNNIDQRYFEPGKYPYEVWQYYSLNGQSNRRFVFWSRKQATNDFDLLHSDARGEIQNPQWRSRLSSGSSAVPTNQNSTPANQFGTDIDRLFQQR